MAESLLPVCSPRYRQQYRPLSGGDRGARLDPCVRIHRRTGSICGMAPVVPAQRTGVTFDGRYYAVNNHSLAIEMALNGLGVVMGRKR